MLGVPTGGNICTATVSGIVQLVMMGLDFVTVNSLYISMNRNSLVRTMLEAKLKTIDGDEEVGYTHILFLDSDMVVPSNILRLLHSEHDITSALYYGAGISSWLGRNCVFGTALGEDDKYINVVEDKVVEAKRIPTGCLLIKREVFEKMEHPWFTEVYAQGRNGIMGEDYRFSEEAKNAGFKLHVDCGVVCGHMKTVCMDPRGGFLVVDSPSKKKGAMERAVLSR